MNWTWRGEEGEAEAGRGEQGGTEAGAETGVEQGGADPKAKGTGRTEEAGEEVTGVEGIEVKGVIEIGDTQVKQANNIVLHRIETKSVRKQETM